MSKEVVPALARLDPEPIVSPYILIRANVPQWAHKIVSLRKEFPDVEEFEAILSAIRKYTRGVACDISPCRIVVTPPEEPAVLFNFNSDGVTLEIVDLYTEDE